MTAATVIKCPLCPWEHQVPLVDPRARSPLTLASVFGVGVFAAVAAVQLAEQVEEALRNHFGCHATEEWLRKVTALQGQLDAAHQMIDELRSGQYLHRPADQG